MAQELGRGREDDPPRPGPVYQRDCGFVVVVFFAFS